MKNDSKKQLVLSIIGIIVLVVAVVSVSYAAFSYSKAGEKVNTITTGTITMNYTEPTSAISISNALPMTDASGKALTGTNNTFDFTVAATIAGSTTINYAITATKDASSTLADTAVKVYLTSANDVTVEKAPTKVSALTKTGASEASGAPSGQYILKTGTTAATVSTIYRLRMWVADDYAGESTGITSKTYKLKVNVYGKAAAK